MKLKVYDDSTNYVCQVIKLPVKQQVEGLDNLVKINVQGNDCLISKNSDEECLYLFFPAECQISHDFLKANNLYRNTALNLDGTKKGFFEDNRRCKTIKFKGVISTGFVIPITSLKDVIGLNYYSYEFKLGNEFNEINGIEICKKYYKKIPGIKGFSNPKVKTIDKVVDNIFVPQHFDTTHLLKNVHKLKLEDYIAVTYKLHGTSARYYNALVKRPLGIRDRIAKLFGVKIQEEEYNYVCASRKVLKSVGFEELPNKNHFYTSGDLWSEVGKEYFKDKLNPGECVYCEIVGKTYQGEHIQHGYSYGFNKPEVFVYRISNINSKGIEIDLAYQQMKERTRQLGLEYCPEFFYGKLIDFVENYIGTNDSHTIEEMLNEIFYTFLLEKPSIFDNAIVEEGFCLRIDKFPKPEIFKIKSKKFLEHETGLLDKEVINIEDNA